MDCDEVLPNPKRLKTLNYKHDDGNNFFHQLVIKYSSENSLCSESYVNAMLKTMPDISVNALNSNGLSALHVAVLEKNLFMVKKLLSCISNIDVNAKTGCNFNENTALHLAIEASLNTKTIDSYGISVIDSAEQKIYHGIILELLNKGANVNIKNRHGYTAMCLGAMSGDVQILSMLEVCGASVNLMGACCSPLHFAVKSGNLKAVRYLVRSGGDLKAVNFKSGTVLHYAAQADALEVVEFLVEKKVNVEARDKDGSTPLYYAAKLGDFATVDFLVTDCSAKVNVENAKKLTPLCCAAQSGNLGVVDFLVSKGAETNVKTVDGLSPLHFAAQSGKLETTKFLMDKSVNLDLRGESGCKLLIAAVESKNLKILDFILNKGVNVDSVNESGDTPLLHITSRSTDLNSIIVLVRHGANVNVKNQRSKVTPLHYAARSGNVEILKFLVNIGAEVNAKDINNNTPLHEAVCSNSLDSVTYLVNQGAFLDAVNKDGKTPLLLAVSKNSSKAGAFLIDNGASMEIVYNGGKTLLHMAVLESTKRCIKMLIQKGANVNAKDEGYGSTPLHDLLRHLVPLLFDKSNENEINGYLMKSKLLLELNADVNIEDRNRETPLCIAMRSLNYDLIKLFIESANEPKNVKDKYGITPLCYAIEFDHMDIIELFLAKGVDLDSKNEDNTTALSYAIQLDPKSNIVKLLMAN